MLATPVQLYHDAKPAICESPFYVVGKTVSGRVKIHIRCPRTTPCEICEFKTRTRLRKVLKMADKFNVEFLKLVTITKDSTPGESGKTPAELASDLMAGFRSLRHKWNEKRFGHKPPQYAWVLEFGPKTQRPHLHILVYDPGDVIPLADTMDDKDGRRKYRTLDDWYKSQSTAAQKFYDFGKKHGLGLYNAESVESNAYGAANYMTKYLEKSVETAKLVGPRRRTFGRSNGWPRDAKFQPRFDLVGSVFLNESSINREYPDHKVRSYGQMDGIELHDAICSDIRHQLLGSRNPVGSSILNEIDVFDKEIAKLSSKMTESDREIVRNSRMKHEYSIGRCTFMKYSFRTHKSDPEIVQEIEKLKTARSDAVHHWRLVTRYSGTWSFVKYIRKLMAAPSRDPFENLFLSNFYEIFKVNLGKRSLDQLIKDLNGPSYTHLDEYLVNDPSTT